MSKVAVLIPVYNNQEGISLTISSLKNEQELNVDIFVIDDGSVPAIICPDKINGHKVYLIRMEKNAGIESALNYGLEIIQKRGYHYIARIDAGDIVLKNRFSKQAAFLYAHQDMAMVGSYTDFKTNEGKLHLTYKPPTKVETIKRKMHLNSCFSHPAIMFKTEILDEIGPYSLKYKSAEDYEFFFRVVKKYNTANLDEVLLEEEFNDTGISATRRRQQLLSRLKIQAEYFNFKEIYSYLGVFQTIGLLFFSRKFVELLKANTQ